MKSNILCLQECEGGAADGGTTVSTYVAGRKDGETQMIKLPGQAGADTLKATQVYDVRDHAQNKIVM